jgi:hypothetical protein
LISHNTRISNAEVVTDSLVRAGPEGIGEHPKRLAIDTEDPKEAIRKCMDHHLQSVVQTLIKVKVIIYDVKVIY